jgi:hypothetical protein
MARPNSPRIASIAHALNAPERRTACLSACGRYRYDLVREWDAGLPQATWIMLNPSRADAFQDDPTIRRCRSFSRRWRCGGFRVVNLFAWRTPEPSALLRSPDPVGPRNDAAILRAARASTRVIIAWGVPPGRLKQRCCDVLDLLARHGVGLECLGVTRAGYPRHPLYVPGDVVPRLVETTQNKGTAAISAETENKIRPGSQAS